MGFVFVFKFIDIVIDIMGSARVRVYVWRRWAMAVIGVEMIEYWHFVEYPII